MGTERALSGQKTVGQAGVIDFHGARVPVGYVASFAKSNCNCGCYGRGFVKRPGLNAEGRERFTTCQRTEDRALRALAKGKVNPSAKARSEVYIVTDEDRIAFEEEGRKWLARHPESVSPASAKSGAASAGNTEEVVPEAPSGAWPVAMEETDERWRR